jgi:conjugal transfer/entry exclusion protein
MKNGNTNLVQKVARIQKQITSKQKEIDQLDGRLQNINDMLAEKTKGSKTAEDMVAKLEAELARKRKKLKKSMETFQKTFPQLGG